MTPDMVGGSFTDAILQILQANVPEDEEILRVKDAQWHYAQQTYGLLRPESSISTELLQSALIPLCLQFSPSRYMRTMSLAGCWALLTMVGLMGRLGRAPLASYPGG